MTEEASRSPAALGIFALPRYEVGHVSAIELTDTLRIATDPRPWAHAIEFTPRFGPDFRDGAVVVEIRVEVESGHVEIGALSDRGSVFLDESRVGPGIHTVRLHVAAVSHCRSISIRNAAVPGVSVVRVFSIVDHPDTAAADQVDGPDFSAAYGSSRRGFWDKNIFRDVRVLAGDQVSTVFQVGAHYGEEASLYARLFPRAVVHCFEPAPSAFAVLERRLTGADRMLLHRVAVADHRGTVPFFVNAKDETNSTYPFAPGANRYADVTPRGASIEVPATTIDALVDELAVDTVDVLNLDIQGAELAALRGAERTLRSQRIKVIVAELIFVALYEGQAPSYAIQEFLARAGYGLYDFYNFAYDGSGKLLWGDALFVTESQLASHLS